MQTFLKIIQKSEFQKKIIICKYLIDTYTRTNYLCNHDGWNSNVQILKSLIKVTDVKDVRMV